MKVISQNMQNEVFHKFATKMSIPPPSTINLIVGGKVFKNIWTAHVTATSTMQREQQSSLPQTLVQQDLFGDMHVDHSLSLWNSDQSNYELDMMLSEEDNDLDSKVPATTISTETTTQEIADIHVFHENTTVRHQ